jgi:hypothetical protein
MAVRIFLTQSLVALLVSSGGAFAAEPGITTGPAAGTNVEPSTALQKGSGAGSSEGSSVAAGSPGVEAKPGTEAGKAEESRAPADGAKGRTFDVEGGDTPQTAGWNPCGGRYDFVGVWRGLSF